MSPQIRNYRERDLELLVVLLNAVEAVDHVEEGTSVAEQREWFERPGLKPEENVFVAEDQDGRVVGFAWMEFVREPDENGFRTRLNVHPMYRGRGLEDRLLAQLLRRAGERLGEAETPRVYFSIIGHSVYGERLRAFERAGMKEIRRFWTMRRGSLEDLPRPRFAPDLITRSYRMGEDDAEALDALNDSFSAHFGHADETPATWQHYLNSIAYRPDLTVLAIDPRRDRIAGFCHIAVSEGECERLGRSRGWIDILGVREEYRRRGLGEALLLQGMHNLRAAGMQEAALGCDSQNTTNATRLYFRVGFEVWLERIAYEKLLREPRLEFTGEQALEVN